jgi:hypothetical protein
MDSPLEEKFADVKRCLPYPSDAASALYPHMIPDLRPLAMPMKIVGF